MGSCQKTLLDTEVAYLGSFSFSVIFSLFSALVICDVYDNFFSSVCASCSLLTHWGDTNSLDHITGDIFAIWWEKKYDHEEDARALLSTLSQIRAECLLNLGMADPPNPGRGNFYNVYIHHKEDDLFPSGWALGQGTDESRNPYLTVPFGSLGNKRIWHEGFHIFQYSATSPGFEYRGDSMWYIEASAQWYMAQKTPHERDTYVEAGAIVGNPQLALWRSFSNEAPGDFGSAEGRPGWMYGVRQYGMHTLLTYLTEVAGIDKDIVTAGFYANTELSPQEYIKSRVGSTVFQRYFADWAGHNCANMDYLTREQYERGLLEISLAGVHPPKSLRSEVGRTMFGTSQILRMRCTPSSWKGRLLEAKVERHNLREG